MGTPQSINKVFLCGRVGENPDIMATTKGKPCVGFSLATKETWRDKSDQPQEKTDWHRIVAWGPLAEICGQVVTKGSLVHVEGRLRTRKYKDVNDNDRYITEVILVDLVMMSNKPKTEKEGG